VVATANTLLIPKPPAQDHDSSSAFRLRGVNAFATFWRHPLVCWRNLEETR